MDAMVSLVAFAAITGISEVVSSAAPGAAPVVVTARQ